MSAPRLQLDFAAPRRRATPLARLVLVIAVLALAWSGTEGVRAWTTRLQHEEALSSVRTPPLAATSPRAEAQDPAQQAQLRLVRSAAQRLQTPWADLLAALESAPSDAVALLSIEPSVQKQSVRLSAEARDARAMLRYVEELQKDGRLRQVVLLSHQVQAQAPGTPVRFQVQAGWGDAP